jgi:protein tyrosine phosphatase
MDDNDIKLRDQLAVAAMQALLSQYKQNYNTMSYTNNRIDGTEYSKMDNGTINTNQIETEFDKDYIARIEKKIELIGDLSYKIADAMRKSRLKSFT